jgi:hypothetical protein
LLLGGTEKPISLGTVRRLRYTENDRTFNTAGIYTDEFGKTRFTIMKPIIINKIITIALKKIIH